MVLRKSFFKDKTQQTATQVQSKPIDQQTAKILTDSALKVARSKPGSITQRKSEGFISKVGHAIDNVVDTAKKVVSTIYNDGKDVVKAINDDIKGVAQGTGNVVNKAIDTGGSVINNTVESAENLGREGFKTASNLGWPLAVGGVAVAIIMLKK